MKRIKRPAPSLFLGSIILMLTLSEGYTVVYNNGNRLNVLASSLNMRFKPSIKAKMMVKIPYGAKVKIIQKTRKAYKSEGIKGHWVKVSYGKRTGYIFDGYLTKLPVPPKHCKDLEHYADSKLGKIGKLHKKDLRRTEKGEKIYEIVTWQNYRYNAVLMYESSGVEETDLGFTEKTLKIKNISMEEGFLIGRLCTKDFRNRVFKVNPKREIYFEKEMDLGTGHLRIKKDKKGYILIAAGYSS